jgi:hypothetical protein
VGIRMQNQKGNALAAVVVAVLVLATLVVLTSRILPLMPADSDSIEKIRSETNFGVEKSVLVSVDSVMKKGFSDNRVWYYNNPMPALLPEVNEKMTERMKADVNAFLAGLEKERDYNYSENISFKLKIKFTDTANLTEILNEVAGLPDKYFKFDLKDLYASSFKGDKNKTVDLSGEKVFALRTWLMYKKMFFWIKNLNLASDACNSIENNRTCHLSYCWCGSTSTAMIPDSVIGNYVDFLGILSDFNASVNESLVQLNSDFKGTGIKCSVDYNALSVDYTVLREQICIDDCQYNSCVAGQKGCGNLFSGTSNKVCAEWANTNPFLGDYNITKRKVLVENKVFNSTELTPKEALQGGCPKATVENVAINPGIFSVIELTCFDSNSLIGGAEKIGPVQARIDLIVSVVSACSPKYVHSGIKKNNVCIGFNQYGKGPHGDTSDKNGDHDANVGVGGDDSNPDKNKQSSYGPCDPQDVCPDLVATVGKCQSVVCRDASCKLKDKCSACAPCNEETGSCEPIDCVAETGDVCANCRVTAKGYKCVIEKPDCQAMSDACNVYEATPDGCACNLVKSVSCTGPPKCSGEVLQAQECNPLTGVCEYVDYQDCSALGKICEAGQCKEGSPL